MTSFLNGNHRDMGINVPRYAYSPFLSPETTTSMAFVPFLVIRNKCSFMPSKSSRWETSMTLSMSSEGMSHLWKKATPRSRPRGIYIKQVWSTFELSSTWGYSRRGVLGYLRRVSVRCGVD